MAYQECVCMGDPLCNECLYQAHLSGEYLDLGEITQLLEAGYIIEPFHPVWKNEDTDNG